jgi:N-acetylmuramoyl-L-alanine amidase
VQVIVNDSTGSLSRRASRRGRQAAEFTPWKAMQSAFSVALVVATLFTLFTPANLFSNNLLDRMLQSVQPVAGVTAVPTLAPSSRGRIGLVAGHWGNDSGSVCADGLTEMEVNLRIATLTQDLLVKEGYDVDVIKEFDPRLTEYTALALVSIHNDSCDYINDQATGFKVAAAASSVYPEKAVRLTACLSQRYQQITGMSYHYNTVTRDMTEYHAFSEINSDTTAAIIETGFLNLDREILTQRPELVAQGVASGILCFLRNEDIPDVPTPEP